MIERVGAAILTSTTLYRGGKIIVYAALANLSSRDQLVVHFATEQRFDFTLSDPDGNEYWRWSDGAEFAQVEGQVVVEPGSYHLFDLVLEELPMMDKEAEYVTLAGHIVSDDFPFFGNIRLQMAM